MKLIQKLFFLILFLSVLILSFPLFYLFSLNIDAVSEEMIRYDFAKMPITNYEGEVTPFSLATYPLSISATGLKKELYCRKLTPRPDSSDAICYELVLKKNGETRNVKIGEICYFQFSEGKDLQFSQAPTDFYVKMTGQTEAKGNFQMFYVAHYRDEKRVKKVNFSLPVTDKAIEDLSLLSANPSILFFLNCKWLKSDLLFLFSHKEEQGSRLRICSEQGDKLYFSLKETDLLVYKDARWLLSDGKTEGFPVAKVGGISGDFLLMDIWDEAGVHYKARLSLAKETPLSKGDTEIFSGITFRSKNHVSCQIGKQRVMMRASDLFALKKGKWRLVNKGKIEQNVTGDAQQFFYFDKVNKKSDGYFFTGVLFNATRSEKKLVEIPIPGAGEKNKQLRKSKS